MSVRKIICAAYAILPLFKLIVIDIDYFVHAHTRSAAEKKTTVELLTLGLTSFPLFFFKVPLVVIKAKMIKSYTEEL